MTKPAKAGSSASHTVRDAALLGLALALVLAFLFSSSFKEGWAQFNNDGPLGTHHAAYMKTPEAFSGVWQDLNWVGNQGGYLTPSLVFSQFYLLGPIAFAKFHAPISLLMLGLCAWLACRMLGLHPAAAILTGIAAALNSNFFSNACWGLSNWPGSVAMCFLAIGLIGSKSPSPSWLRCALAGLAVGMAVLNGSDIGIILSLFVGVFGLVFLFTQRLHQHPGQWVPAAGLAAAKMAVVVACTAFMAWSSVDMLLNVAKVKQAVDAQKELMSPEQQWDWATQWSLPKSETLRLIIPGLHGYRMDTPDGGGYWGAAGRTPGWDTHHQGIPRFSGSGEYTGVAVVVVALLAFVLAHRRKNNPFTPQERILIAFWAAAGLISLLFAWGRFAPFYKILFHLPIFSSIRNPIKWTHGVQLCLLMLFAYGIHGLWTACVETAAKRLSFKSWWAQASHSDRRWVTGSTAFLGLSVLCWMLYITSTADLTQHLVNQAVGAGDPRTPEVAAREVAKFSQHEVGIYLLFLTASLAWVLFMLRGTFSGTTGRVANILLGLLLLVDLSRANTPWVRSYDYQARYAPTVLTDFLSQQGQVAPARTTVAPFNTPQLANLRQIYHGEWLQHQFPYYNIPCLDFIQDPRPLPENDRFKQLFTGTNITRLWELTSTRYLLALGGGFTEAINSQLDGGRGRFRQVLGLELYNADNNLIGIRSNAAAPFAVVEFTAALPRAGFYSKWTSQSQEAEVLKRLVDPDFAPATEVVVSDSTLPSAPADAKAGGAVQVTAYAPKRISLKSESAGPGVVMLTDKFDPNWTVTVDGKPAELLRCNFLFRGVHVPAGTHVIEFAFHPNTGAMYVSLAAIAASILITGILVVGRWKTPADTKSQAA